MPGVDIPDLVMPGFAAPGALFQSHRKEPAVCSRRVVETFPPTAVRFPAQALQPSRAAYRLVMTAIKPADGEAMQIGCVTGSAHPVTPERQRGLTRLRVWGDHDNPQEHQDHASKRASE